MGANLNSILISFVFLCSEMLSSWVEAGVGRMVTAVDNNFEGNTYNFYLF